MRVSEHTPLGIAHFTVIGVPPLDLVGLAARIGYSTIGLRLHPAFPGAPSYDVRSGSEVSREMKRRLDGEGIGVYDIEFVTIDAKFVPAALKQMLEDASVLGAKRLSVCGDDPDRYRLINNFSVLCDIAAEFAMGVDIECMAWRTISSLSLAADIVRQAARSNGGLLIDALHLSRTGGEPDMLKGIDPGMLRSAQLCDAPKRSPVGNDAIIAEARGGRSAPGDGELPLSHLIAVLPEHAVLSVEVPIAGATTPDDHATRIFTRTNSFFASCCPAR